MLDFALAASALILVLAMALGLLLVRRHLKGSKCTRKERLDGRTVVITGCNTGIGKETAMELSRRGARIVMACRDLKRAETAAEQIKKETGGSVLIYHLDLADLSSVRECARQIIAKEDRVDVLINNAGVSLVVGDLKRTKEGHELHFGTNHLGHFLFTNLLLDKIRQTGSDARVINVSSTVGKPPAARIDLVDPNYNSRTYTSYKAYRSSKLANLLFNVDLARRLEGTGIVCVALHPGIVNSDISRHLMSWAHPLLRASLEFLAPFFLKDCLDGAQTTLHCALCPDLKSGAYYSECREEAVGLDRAEAKKLWEVSSKMVGLSDSKTE